MDDVDDLVIQKLLHQISKIKLLAQNYLFEMYEFYWHQSWIIFPKSLDKIS